MSAEKILMKDLLNDESLAKRMDSWYEETGVTITKDGEKFKMTNLKGKDEGSYTLDELIEEYKFEAANTQVPKRCVE